jgi:omega-6 fatty acid desaturase (delta-12 desaturase)
MAWFTGNIGVHHVHHLASRIPFYRLPQVLRDYPQLASIGRITFLQSLRCATLSLWDEDQRRLISFRDLSLQSPSMAAIPTSARRSFGDCQFNPEQ